MGIVEQAKRKQPLTSSSKLSLWCLVFFVNSISATEYKEVNYNADVDNNNTHAEWSRRVAQENTFPGNFCKFKSAHINKTKHIKFNLQN